MAKNSKSKVDMLKDKEFQKEFKKFKKIFKNIDEHKLELVSGLIEQAAFMKKSLQELKESIQKNGMVSEYQNGANQWGTKKSPEIEIYNAMVKNYSSVIKQLTELLPTSETHDDDLMEFLKGN